MTSSRGPRESSSSYQDYPANLSMLSDRYAVETPKRVNTAPESNNRAVISALLGLQEKIRRLEQERSEAEGNLKSLADETAQYRDLVQRRHTVRQTPPSSKQTHELQGQLASAESRSHLLEKQLEYMRNMVRSAEQERDSALRQQELQSRQRTAKATEQARHEEEKIRGLEREHAKLKATQALAESKLEDLEHKVTEEKHRRELLQSRATQLQPRTEPSKMSSGKDVAHKAKKKAKKKTRVPATVSSKLPCRSQQPCTSRHLRLKMENVPFVAGTAITPSHNVNMNMQNLIALMKTHHTAWCGKASTRTQAHRVKSKTKKSRALASGTSSDSELSDLLLGLQDEFGQLAFEHQELSKQIQETTEVRLQDQLEQELEHVFSRMEAKGEQINKLKKHKQKVTVKQTTNNATKRRPSGPVGTAREGEVKVITTVRTRATGIRTKPIQLVSPGAQSPKLMLHDMKTLQTSLCKDDVSWD